VQYNYEEGGIGLSPAYLLLEGNFSYRILRGDLLYTFFDVRSITSDTGNTALFGRVFVDNADNVF
jgi:hypothetical protein